MSVKMIHVAQNILANLNKSEVDYLISILSYYNICEESQRVQCLQGACQYPRDESLENDCKDSVQDSRDGLARYSRTKSAGEIYLTTDKPICPCCRR